MRPSGSPPSLEQGSPQIIAVASPDEDMRELLRRSVKRAGSRDLFHLLQLHCPDLLARCDSDERDMLLDQLGIDLPLYRALPRENERDLKDTMVMGMCHAAILDMNFHISRAMRRLLAQHHMHPEGMPVGLLDLVGTPPAWSKDIARLSNQKDTETFLRSLYDGLNKRAEAQSEAYLSRLEKHAEALLPHIRAIVAQERRKLRAQHGFFSTPQEQDAASSLAAFITNFAFVPERRM